MIIHYFLCGVLIRLIGSEENSKCQGKISVIENPKNCIDWVFRVCTKSADDVKDMNVKYQVPVKKRQCAEDVLRLVNTLSNLIFLTVMEKYDYKADYYKDFQDYGHTYIKKLVRYFKDDDDYNKFRTLFCPNYTMQACRALLTFCDIEEFAKLAFCKHPSHKLYIEYMRCYYTPGVAKPNCAMICDKGKTMELFRTQKTDDSKCKTGKSRCEDVETTSLIHECEGNFKAKCDVSTTDTYSKCEEAIRSMKASPQLLSSILENHKCNDPNSRLICFQYLKLLGEGKMSSQFVRSQCVKKEKPEICTVLEEYCGNSNLTLPDDPPECKQQTEETTTSTLASFNQSSQSATTTALSHNRQTEQQISPILLIGLLFVLEFIFE